MITEDYVSFETAKLLKEKEFKGNSIFTIYDENAANAYIKELQEKHLPYSSDNPKLKEFYYTQPTLQMAMKWLREDKKILISIFCHIDKGYWFCIQHFIESPYKFATSESIHRKEEILGKIQYYDTYEGACEAAIKYCLEHLI